MKKLISVIAALSVFISVLSFATVSVTANGTAEQPSNKEYELLTKIDFESEEQSQFYSDTANKLGANMELQGNVIHYTRTVGSVWNWANKILLSDNAGINPLNTRTLDTVKISVDIKADSINDDLDRINVGIAYTTQANANWLSGNDGNGWANVEKKTDIITINKSDLSTSEWKTFTGEFTVPSHTKEELPFIYLYSVESSGDFWNNQIELADIVVERLISDNEISVVDFDSEEQPTFYSDTTNNLGGRMKYEESGDSKYGKVIYYEAIGDIGWNYANKILLSDNVGIYSLNTRRYDTVKISVDIKAKNINDALNQIKVGIAYTNQELANELSNTDTTGWTRVEKKTDIITINKSDLSTSEWKTFTGEFMVPFHNKKELPFIYLYSSDSGDAWKTQLWLDNIIIEQPKAEKSGVTDFDSYAQKDFYSQESAFWKNITTRRGKLKSLDGEDASHGTVYVAHSAAQRGEDRGNGDVGVAAAIALCNTAGTARLHPETGDEIFVTAEVKNTIPSDQNVYLALVFDDYPGDDVGAWNKGLFEHWGRCYDLGKVDMRNTDWQRIGVKVKVPEIDAAVKTPKLVLYTQDSQEFGGLEIYIDNIIVEEVSNINGDVNRDNETDIRDLIALKKRAVSNQYDVFADVSFDGKLNATDCSLLRHLLLNR